MTADLTDLFGENRFGLKPADLTSHYHVNYQYGSALGNRRDRARGEPDLGRTPSRGVLSPGPLGLRTDLMWDRLDMIATLDEPAPGLVAWEDGLVPPVIDRHPGDEEEDEEFDDEVEDDEEEELEDDFDDDEEDDFDDEEFDDEDELDEDLDDIDDIDVDEDEDLDEDDDDLDDLDDDEEEEEAEDV